MNLKDKLFSEKYRPKTIDEYVFVDERLKTQVMSWINEGSCPNILLTGDAGTGKTSLAKMLISELDVADFDVLEINASRDNGVDMVRDKILGFIQTMPFGKFKCVLLDEFDHFTAPAQAMLRNDIEAYSGSVRFILTGNYPHRIIPAIKSRCHEIQISRPDRVELTTRAATILLNEEIVFELEDLDAYVNQTYPDMRKLLNQLQMNISDGKLMPPSSGASAHDEELINIAKMFKSGNITQARTSLLAFLASNPSQIEEIYKFFYQNLDLWGDTPAHHDAAILIIRNGLVTLSQVGIPEIALAATIIELTSI